MFVNTLKIRTGKSWVKSAADFMVLLTLMPKDIREWSLVLVKGESTE